MYSGSYSYPYSVPYSYPYSVPYSVPYTVPDDETELMNNYKKYIEPDTCDSKKKSYKVELYIVNTKGEFEPVTMKLDTGAEMSILNPKYLNSALDVKCTKTSGVCFSKRCSIESSGKIAQLYVKKEQGVQYVQGVQKWDSTYVPIYVEICSNSSTSSLLGMSTLNSLGMTSIDFVNKKIVLDTESGAYIQLIN